MLRQSKKVLFYPVIIMLVRLCFKDTVCCHCIFQNNKIYKEESKLVTILRKMPISFKMTFALTLTR